ncbi:50S ribosomal protein L28 [Desulfofalx alkaliphila]|uniref:50S ribosomal protein L28 n=1 Tax=Desulfofalx alkaliphila TaxID=105483 RepID=UPI000A07B700|nr:50S ribosomal protein L28 [Desulfofalx alkaliphila]
MARKCDVCGKGVITGYKYSHSHIRTKRKWKPNLQRVRIVVGGSPRRILVCTRCLRSGKVKRAI